MPHFYLDDGRKAECTCAAGGEVAAERKFGARVFEAFETPKPAELVRADELFAVGIIGCPQRSALRYYTKFPKAGNVLIGYDLDMADRIASLRLRVHGLRCFDGIERFMNRTFTKCMHVHVHIDCRRSRDHVRHLFFGEYRLTG